MTFDEFNELLPSTAAPPEHIEAVMKVLSDEGIDVIEDEGPWPDQASAY